MTEDTRQRMTLERITILREAFFKTFKSPEVIEEDDAVLFGAATYIATVPIS